ncbi:MAG TPA: hypothetical protein VF407_24665 [Polyangiaceae bacterium]
MTAAWIEELVAPTFREADDTEAEGPRLRRAALRSFERSLPPHYRDARLESATIARRVKLPLPRELPTAKSVVFMGPPGIGKTTLAVALFRARFERELERTAPTSDVDVTRSVLQFRFVHAHRLAVARINGAEGLAELAASIRARVLLIDDLGEGATVASNPVRDVIQERHADERETWLTTNFGPKAIAERYGAGIARRIFERATIVRAGAQSTVDPPVAPFHDANQGLRK